MQPGDTTAAHHHVFVIILLHTTLVIHIVWRCERKWLGSKGENGFFLSFQNCSQLLSSIEALRAVGHYRIPGNFGAIKFGKMARNRLD